MHTHNFFFFTREGTADEYIHIFFFPGRGIAEAHKTFVFPCGTKREINCNVYLHESVLTKVRMVTMSMATRDTQIDPK